MLVENTKDSLPKDGCLWVSGLGWLIAVFLGVVIPFTVSHVTDMKTIITFWSPLLAFSISAFVCVTFGIYPAMRAAEMDPVDALRHEQSISPSQL